MIYSKSSKQTIDQVEARLRDAAQRHKFGVLNVLDLRQTLQNKGFELQRDCKIIDVCNPSVAMQALQQDMQVATALPCRLAVYSDSQGATVIAAILPTDMLAATGAAGVATLAAEVDREVKAIIDEAVA